MWRRSINVTRSTTLRLHRQWFSSIERLKGEYPHIMPNEKPTMSVTAFRDQFDSLKRGDRLEHHDTPIVFCGRITSIRESSKKLYFYNIQVETESSIQVLAQQQFFSNVEEFAQVHSQLRAGDIVSVSGFPGKSKTGELSIIPRNVKCLSYCLMNIPSGRGDGKFALQDKHTRHTKRHIDMLANGPVAREPFLVRAKAIQLIRKFLDSRNFVEVETPILVPSAGGALAEPFFTKAKASGDSEICLRIAPELYLKQIVIGGVDRVFELGKVFRNEGTSLVHNPEFTSCELYQAYADYTDMMELTETLLEYLTKEILGSTVLPCGVDVAPPYPRISVISELESIYGLEPGTFPDVNDLSKVEETGKTLEQLLRTMHPNLSLTGLSQETSVARNCKLVDKMIGSDLEPRCHQPTFLCDHPIAMSPLAKAHPNLPGMSQRFELFIKGKELVNAYTELNDPDEQLRRFELQRYGHIDTNTELEVMPIDSDYVNSMKYGLPPTGGWGMGVDRLIMLLTGKSSIRDIILFPMMNAKDHQ